MKVVATSREALLLQGEHVMALGPLSMDDHDGEGCADAVALFIERLTAEGGPAIVDGDERAVVLEICRQLDGMPLAIELAAGRDRDAQTAQTRDATHHGRVDGDPVDVGQATSSRSRRQAGPGSHRDHAVLGLGLSYERAAECQRRGYACVFIECPQPAISGTRLQA